MAATVENPAPVTYVCASGALHETVASVLATDGRRQAKLIAPAELDRLTTRDDDALVLDLEGLGGRLLPSHLVHERMILLCDRDLPSMVELLVQYDGLCHVLTKSSFLLERQLAATLLQMQRMDVDISTYLSSSSTLETHIITNSDSKQACVDRVHALAKESGAFSEFADIAATVATELLMNAMFNAPVESGSPKYKDLPRNESLSLASAEAVRLEVGRDEQVLVLRIEDNFGSLDRRTLVENLSRSSHAGGSQIRMKTAGAGIGLYMVLNSTNQLDFAVMPGRSTRVTAVLALTKRYKDFEKLGSALNFHHRS